MPSDRRTWVGLALVVGLLLQGAHTLVAAPQRGMADNGDFWRVTSAAGLRSPVSVGALRHRFVQPTYLRGTPSPDARFSSAGLVARAAAAWPMGLREPFPLRRMGMLLLCLATALFALGAAQGAPLLVCAAVSWVLTDPGYLLFFNSFYADGVALLGVVGVAIVLCGTRPGGPSVGALVALVACAFAIAFSKQAHAPVALLTGAAILCIGPARRSVRGPVVACLCGCLCAGGAYHFTRGSGHRFPHINNYNAVFAGIGVVASRPPQALAGLGIGRAHHDRAGSHYFQGPVPAALARDLGGLSRLQLARTYLSDPVAVGRAAQRVQQRLAAERRFLGNYPYSRADPVPRIHAPGWAFSRVRQALLPAPGAFWLAWLAAAVWAWRAGRRARWAAGAWVAVGLLGITAAVESAVAVLGDGFFSLSRHLLMARFATDLMFAIAAASAVERGLRRREISGAARGDIG